MSQSSLLQPFVFKGTGEMVRLINNHNWNQSSLGSIDRWPKSLIHTVDLMLNAAFPMFLFWGDEQTCFYNDAFIPALGKEGKHPGAIGKKARIVWDEMWTTIEPLINSVIEGQNTGLIEDQLIPIYRNGSIEDAFWTFSYNPVKNDEGKVEGVLAICLETTNKVKESKTNDAIHNALALALEATEMGTWELDPITMHFSCNERTKEIFGLSGVENINLQVAVDVIEHEDRSKIKEAIDWALDIRSGGRYDVEYTVIHPGNGNRHNVRAKGKVFFNNGRAEKFSGTIKDITEERKASSRKEKLLQLVENSVDFMSMATLEGDMTYMNPAAKKMVGISPDLDLSTLRIKDFYSEEQLKKIRDEVIPKMNSEGEWSGKIQIRHMISGEEIPCHANYFLVKDPNSGKVISRAARLRDLRLELIARKELEESELRFQNLVQQAPVATAIYLGKEMKIQWANEAMIKLWGKDDSVVGKTLHEALPEIKDQPFHGLLQKVYTTGEMYQATEDKGELVVDGKLQTYFFNYSYKPLRDSEGKIYGIMNMAIDVTEMVINKRKLQESEYAFKNLILKAPVGICLLKGTDFVVDIANDNYAFLVGRSGKDLHGRPIWDVIPEAKAQGFDQLLEGVRNSGKPYIGNEQAVDLVRNGITETVYLNFVYEPLFDEEGIVNSILVIAIDISQQVKLRQKIQETEEQARMAVASGNFGTYEVDLTTGKVLGSSRFNEIFDFDEDNIHQGYVNKINPEDLPAREKAHKEAEQTGLLRYECRIRKRDGSENWVQINGQREREKYIGIVQDITAVKNLELELERRVKERTNELVQVNEELQQFIYITSHDLKEPLRKIQVFGSMAKEQAELDNVKQITSLDKVVQSANRLSSLLNDLIQYSALSDVSQPTELVDLNEVMKNTLSDLEIVIRETDAVIEWENLPSLNGIHFQLARLFYNLIYNALKFSKPEEAPAVAVRSFLISDAEKLTHGLSQGKPYYKIEVADQGIGFDVQFSEKIFVVFQQLHGKNQYSGNGIGLAICKKIVERHQGKIWASGKKDEGAVFSFILPAY